MKRCISRMAAGMLSAVMLFAALPADAVSAETTSEATFRRVLRQAWPMLKERLNISSLRLTFDQVADIYYDTLYTDSDWFYVDSSFSYVLDSQKRVTSVVVNYAYDKDKIPAMIDEFNAEVDRVTGLVNPEWTDAEKILFLHDHLGEVCEYDLTYEKNDAYAAMLGGTAVCQGYALAMNVLCRELEIPCCAVTSDKLNHMWNAVKIDGHWYHVDATFDDSAPDMLGHITHRYLLCSDAYMMADSMHSATDWNFISDDSAVVCDSDAYENAFWCGAIDTCEPLPEGGWLFSSAADPAKVQFVSDIVSDIIVASPDGSEKISTVRAAWPTETGSYFTTCYVMTDYYNGKIYYSTAERIMAMPLAGGKAETVYTLSAAEQAYGRIYGFKIDDNGLMTYQVMPLPAFRDADHYVSEAEFHTLQLPQQSEPVTTTAPPETTVRYTTTTPVIYSDGPFVVTTLPPPTEPPVTTTTARILTDAPPVVTTLPPVTTTTRTETTAAVTAPVIPPNGPSVTTLPVSTTAKTTTTKAATTTKAVTTTKAATTTKAVTTTKAATTTKAITTTKAVTTTVRTTTAATPTTAAVTATAPVTTAAETVTTFRQLTITRRGDINLDDAVDVSDAVMLARLLVEDRNLKVSDQGMMNAHCTNDDEITGDDLVWILRVIARIIDGD